MTTPSAKLHVEVSASYPNPLLKVYVEDSSKPYFIITSSGNIGMGFANPVERLSILGNIYFSGSLMPAGNAGTAGQVLVSQCPGAPPQWQNVNSTSGDSECASAMINYGMSCLENLLIL